MSSSTMSSSSFGKHTKSQSFYLCEIEATLRYSNTTRNLGRPFLGCPKYSTEGLPYCSCFKWAKGNQYIEQELQELKNELLRKEEELKRILDDVEMRLIGILKRADAIEKMLSNCVEEVGKKELVLLKQEAEIIWSHILLYMYWAFVIVVSCYLLLSK